MVNLLFDSLLRRSAAIKAGDGNSYLADIPLSTSKLLLSGKAVTVNHGHLTINLFQIPRTITNQEPTECVQKCDCRVRKVHDKVRYHPSSWLRIFITDWGKN